MPVSFRLINVVLAGKGVNDPDFKKAHSLPLSLQDLMLAKASSPGNKTVLRERNLLKALNPKPFRSHHTLLKIKGETGSGMSESCLRIANEFDKIFKKSRRYSML